MDQTVTIREEEIKNSLRDQFFSAYDATPIIGDIDFAVTSRRENPSQQELFDREWFLWAEAKKGPVVPDFRIRHFFFLGIFNPRQII